jgi:hypothetical protein
MAAVNTRRVVLGTLVGGAVWAVWSFLINGVLLSSSYQNAQTFGYILKIPRYPLFLLYWFITLFLLTYILTWVYVGVRVTLGPGPLTALRVGFLVGLLAAFPVNLSVAAWAPMSRVLPLGWMCDLWIGSMMAVLVSAWLYRDPEPARA